ncbi:MAG: hypothetical protein ACO293_08325, partial [Nitrosopumilaceae archaeon]
MKPKAAIAMVVLVFLFGVSTTIQSNLAYATSSEKIILIQQLEQFPGQDITGFCYLEQDEEGNMHWRIKVNGLVPETQGHFDLGHWAGETDVPYVADSDGKADSETQIIISEDIPYSLFSQFAKCRVLTDGYNHLTSPVVALGVPGSANENTVENSDDVDSNEVVTIPTEKKFFLFVMFEQIFDIFTNNNVDSNKNKQTQSSENNPAHSKSENNFGQEITSGNDSVSGASVQTSKNSFDKGPSDKGPSDKGPSDKGPSDKG